MCFSNCGVSLVETSFFCVIFHGTMSTRAGAGEARSSRTIRRGDTRNGWPWYGNGNGFIYGGICVDTYVCVCAFAVIEDDFQGKQQKNLLDIILVRGLQLLPIYIRSYPEKEIAGHIIGYVGSKGKLPTGPINHMDPLWGSISWIMTICRNSIFRGSRSRRTSILMKKTNWSLPLTNTKWLPVLWEHRNLWFRRKWRQQF